MTSSSRRAHSQWAAGASDANAFNQSIRSKPLPCLDQGFKAGITLSLLPAQL